MANMLSLLFASFAFALLGLCWVFTVLYWKYLWVLQLMGFFFITCAIFGLALCCWTMLILQVLYRYRGAIWHLISGTAAAIPEEGLLHLFPAAVISQLNRPVFELLSLANSTFVLPLYNWMRLALLVLFDLSEEDRARLMSEMTREFRKTAFQRPAILALPEVVQWLLLGKKCEPIASTDEGDDADDVPAGLREFADAAYHPHRVDSIEQIQALIRAAEEAPHSSRESSILQNILTEKCSGQAAIFMKQTAVSSYDAQLGDVVQGTVDKLNTIKESITTPPKRWTLRVPWEVARLSLKGASYFLFDGESFPETQSTKQLPLEESIEGHATEGGSDGSTDSSQKKQQ